MFDPQRARHLFDERDNERARAAIGRLKNAQRIALVSLLGGPATFFPRDAGRWVVPCLGHTWAIAQITMDALMRQGLVNINGKARLTERGKWYALTAACREADERYQKACFS